MNEVSLAGIYAGYGGTDVLRDVSIRLRPGECVAVLGPNGAGKSTLLATVTGQLGVRKGKRMIDGADATRWRAHRVARAGVRWVGEPRPIYPDMSVEDNLIVGGFLRRAEAYAHRREIYGMLPMLEERRAQPAGALSGGQQQMLSIGQALMSRPRYVCLDEPSLGLAPHMVTTVADFVVRLAADGVGVLWAEQFPDVALSRANRVVLMGAGTVVRDASPHDVDTEAIEAVYIGTGASGARG